MVGASDKGWMVVRRSACVLGVLAIVAGLGGCYREGGRMRSGAPITYLSTEWRPKTITLTDTRTGAEVWAVDVPVGQQLVVYFSSGTGPNFEFPDEIVWELMEAGRGTGPVSNRQPAPGSSVRRLEMKLRPGPERVGDELPGNPFR